MPGLFKVPPIIPQTPPLLSSPNPLSEERSTALSTAPPINPARGFTPPATSLSLSLLALILALRSVATPPIDRVATAGRRFEGAPGFLANDELGDSTVHGGVSLYADDPHDLIDYPLVYAGNCGSWLCLTGRLDFSKVACCDCGSNARVEKGSIVVELQEVLHSFNYRHG